MQIERRVFIKKIEGECQYSVLLALCIYMTVSLNVTRVGAMKVADFRPVPEATSDSDIVCWSVVLEQTGH